MGLSFGFQHQSEAHQFLAKLLISLIMSRSCSDHQSIKERNYDDLHQSKTELASNIEELVDVIPLSALRTMEFLLRAPPHSKPVASACRLGL